MKIQGRAAAAVSVALVLSGGVGAGAEILADGLSGHQVTTLRAILAVVQAATPDGRPLHPTLHRLYREIDSSVHVVRIRISSARVVTGIAGRFWIESLGADGRHEATITLNLWTIDRVLARSPGAEIVTFEGLSRTERYARVLGHELAHAAWALGDAERARFVVEVQARSLEVARRAQATGTVDEKNRSAVRENERLVRQLEDPALEAEAAVTAELRASR
jgi:hypothetical protein